MEEEDDSVSDSTVLLNDCQYNPEKIAAKRRKLAANYGVSAQVTSENAVPDDENDTINIQTDSANSSLLGENNGAEYHQWRVNKYFNSIDNVQKSNEDMYNEDLMIKRELLKQEACSNQTEDIKEQDLSNHIEVDSKEEDIGVIVIEDSDDDSVADEAKDNNDPNSQVSSDVLPGPYIDKFSKASRIRPKPSAINARRATINHFENNKAVWNSTNIQDNQPRLRIRQPAAINARRATVDISELTENLDIKREINNRNNNETDNLTKNMTVNQTEPEFNKPPVVNETSNTTNEVNIVIKDSQSNDEKRLKHTHATNCDNLKTHTITDSFVVDKSVEGFILNPELTSPRQNYKYNVTEITPHKHTANCGKKDKKKQTNSDENSSLNATNNDFLCNKGVDSTAQLTRGNVSDSSFKNTNPREEENIYVNANEISRKRLSIDITSEDETKRSRNSIDKSNNVENIKNTEANHTPEKKNVHMKTNDGQVFGAPNKNESNNKGSNQSITNTNDEGNSKESLNCEEIERVIEFQVRVCKILKITLEKYCQIPSKDSKKVKAYLKSAESLTNEIESLKALAYDRRAKADIQYACPLCTRVSTYSATLLFPNVGNYRNVETNGEKCKFCRGIGAWYNSYMNKNLQKSNNKTNNGSEVESTIKNVEIPQENNHITHTPSNTYDDVNNRDANMPIIPVEGSPSETIVESNKLLESQGNLNTNQGNITASAETNTSVDIVEGVSPTERSVLNVSKDNIDYSNSADNPLTKSGTSVIGIVSSIDGPDHVNYNKVANNVHDSAEKETSNTIEKNPCKITSTSIVSTTINNDNKDHRGDMADDFSYVVSKFFCNKDVTKFGSSNLKQNHKRKINNHDLKMVFKRVRPNVAAENKDDTAHKVHLRHSDQNSSSNPVDGNESNPCEKKKTSPKHTNENGQNISNIVDRRSHTEDIGDKFKPNDNPKGKKSSKERELVRELSRIETTETQTAEQNKNDAIRESSDNIGQTVEDNEKQSTSSDRARENLATIGPNKLNEVNKKRNSEHRNKQRILNNHELNDTEYDVDTDDQPIGVNKMSDVHTINRQARGVNKKGESINNVHKEVESSKENEKNNTTEELNVSDNRKLDANDEARRINETNHEDGGETETADIDDEENENSTDESATSGDETNNTICKTLVENFEKIKRNLNVPAPPAPHAMNSNAKPHKDLENKVPKQDKLDIKCQTQYECNKCSCVFIYGGRFLRHMIENHNMDLLKIPKECVKRKCNFCPLLLKENAINLHVRKYHLAEFLKDGDANKCEKKSKVVEQNNEVKDVRKNMLIKKDGKWSYICLICNVTVKSVYLARKHRQDKHPEMKNRKLYDKVPIDKIKESNDDEANVTNRGDRDPKNSKKDSGEIFRDDEHDSNESCSEDGSSEHQTDEENDKDHDENSNSEDNCEKENEQASRGSNSEDKDESSGDDSDAECDKSSGSESSPPPISRKYQDNTQKSDELSGNEDHDTTNEDNSDRRSSSDEDKEYDTNHSSEEASCDEGEINRRDENDLNVTRQEGSSDANKSKETETINSDESDDDSSDDDVDAECGKDGTTGINLGEGCYGRPKLNELNAPRANKKHAAIKVSKFKCYFECTICELTLNSYYAVYKHRKEKHPDLKHKKFIEKKVISEYDKPNGDKRDEHFNYEKEQTTGDEDGSDLNSCSGTDHTDENNRDSEYDVNGISGEERNVIVEFRQRRGDISSEEDTGENIESESEASIHYDSSDSNTVEDDEQFKLEKKIPDEYESGDHKNKKCEKKIKRNVERNNEVRNIRKKRLSKKKVGKWRYICLICNVTLNSDYSSRKHRQHKHPDMKNRQLYDRVSVDEINESNDDEDGEHDSNETCSEDGSSEHETDEENDKDHDENSNSEDNCEKENEQESSGSSSEDKDESSCDDSDAECDKSSASESSSPINEQDQEHTQKSDELSGNEDHDTTNEDNSDRRSSSDEDKEYDTNHSSEEASCDEGEINRRDENDLNVTHQEGSSNASKCYFECIICELTLNSYYAVQKHRKEKHPDLKHKKFIEKKVISEYDKPNGDKRDEHFNYEKEQTTRDEDGSDLNSCSGTDHTDENNRDSEYDVNGISGEERNVIVESRQRREDISSEKDTGENIESESEASKNHDSSDSNNEKNDEQDKLYKKISDDDESSDHKNKNKVVERNNEVRNIRKKRLTKKKDGKWTYSHIGLFCDVTINSDYSSRKHRQDKHPDMKNRQLCDKVSVDEINESNDDEANIASRGDCDPKNTKKEIFRDRKHDLNETCSEDRSSEHETDEENNKDHDENRNSKESCEKENEQASSGSSSEDKDESSGDDSDVECDKSSASESSSPINEQDQEHTQKSDELSVDKDHGTTNGDNSDRRSISDEDMEYDTNHSCEEASCDEGEMKRRDEKAQYVTHQGGTSDAKKSKESESSNSDESDNDTSDDYVDAECGKDGTTGINLGERRYGKTKKKDEHFNCEKEQTTRDGDGSDLNSCSGTDHTDKNNRDSEYEVNEIIVEELNEKSQNPSINDHIEDNLKNDGSENHTTDKSTENAIAEPSSDHETFIEDRRLNKNIDKNVDQNKNTMNSIENKKKPSAHNAYKCILCDEYFQSGYFMRIHRDREHPLMNNVKIFKKAVKNCASEENFPKNVESRDKEASKANNATDKESQNHTTEISNLQKSTSASDDSGSKDSRKNVVTDETVKTDENARNFVENGKEHAYVKMNRNRTDKLTGKKDSSNSGGRENVFQKNKKANKHGQEYKENNGNSSDVRKARFSNCHVCAINFDVNEQSDHDCTLSKENDVLYNCYACGANFVNNMEHLCWLARADETWIENIQISNVVTIKDSYVFSCIECKYSTDLYDDVVRHCQNHYLNVVDAVTECETCRLKFDEHRYSTHHNLHVQFEVVKYSYTSLFCNWDAIFDDIPRDVATELKAQSIYTTHSILLTTVEDGPHEYSLYQCDQCKSCVPKHEIEKHYLSRCSEMNYVCSVCDRAFISYEMCVNHENTHRNGAKIFRVIAFNREEDRKNNLKLIESRERQKNDIKSKAPTAELFQCQCDLNFVSMANLKMHFLECDSTCRKGTLCPKCPVKRNFLANELDRHSQLHHSEIIYEFVLNQINIRRSIEPNEVKGGFKTTEQNEPAASELDADEVKLKKELLKQEGSTIVISDDDD